MLARKAELMVVLNGWKSCWQNIHKFLQRQMLRSGKKQSHVTVPAREQLVRKAFCINQAWGSWYTTCWTWGVSKPLWQRESTV